MKIEDALATFDRKGIDVLIKSKHGDMTFEKSEKHDFEDILTLHAKICSPSKPNFVGTEFILKGCSDKDIENAKNLFLRFSGEKNLEETGYGQVLERGKRKKARIYVNGVRVAEEENFLFSYNITSLTKKVRKALNRERTNVGRSAYSGRVKSILLSCKNKNIAAALVGDLKSFQERPLHDELQWIDVSVHACKILNALEKVVFFTPKDLQIAPDSVDRARGDGYEVCVIPENIKEKIRGEYDVSGNMIRDLEQFNVEWNESFEFKYIEENEMSSEERKIFAMTDAILDLVNGKPTTVREIKISETMRLDPQSFREATGVWQEIDGRIIIKRTQLKNLKSYARTLLHEIAHAKGGYPDLSIEFEQQLGSLIGTIVSNVLTRE